MATKISSCHLLLILMIFTSSANAQQTNPLRIGDKVPDLIINKIINQADDSIKIKELYKKGLLIIDFWATWCAPCIREMQYLDSLKGAHPDRFNVLMVSSEPEVIVSRFLAGKPPAFGKNLNIIFADTILNQLFAHRSIPHNIWVDQNGVVRAITSGEEATEKNILNFRTMASGLSPKIDNMTFDSMKEFHLSDSSFLYRSIITKAINMGNGGIYNGNQNGMSNRFFLWNGPAVMLYYMAYALHNKYPSGAWRDGLIEVHTNDSLRLFNPIGRNAHLLKGSKYTNKREWNKENLYCYALTLPKAAPDTIFRQYMFADLERQFGIRAKIENRIIWCNVATRIKKPTIQQIHTVKNTKSNVSWAAGYKLLIEHAKVDDVLRWLYLTYPVQSIPDPYLNEVPKTDDLYFDAELAFSKEDFENGVSLELVYSKLLKLGIKVSKEKRPFPILVLYDQGM